MIVTYSKDSGDGISIQIKNSKRFKFSRCYFLGHQSQEKKINVSFFSKRERMNWRRSIQTSFIEVCSHCRRVITREVTVEVERGTEICDLILRGSDINEICNRVVKKDRCE